MFLTFFPPWLSSISAAGLSRSSSHLPPLFTHWIPPVHLTSCSEQTNEWLSPGSQERREHSSHYLCSFHFHSLSLVCLEYVSYLTAYTLHWAPTATEEWSAPSLCLINMLMVRGSVCACVRTHWINGGALLWFRPGSQKEASVQGCLRTHNTTEHFNHHTAGGWESVCVCVCKWVLVRRGKRETFSSLQLRAVGVNMMTFRLHTYAV